MLLSEGMKATGLGEYGLPMPCLIGFCTSVKFKLDLNILKYTNNFNSRPDKTPARDRGFLSLARIPAKPPTDKSDARRENFSLHVPRIFFLSVSGQILKTRPGLSDKA